MRGYVPSENLKRHFSVLNNTANVKVKVMVKR